MASNSLGQIFRITTWGESYGKAIGVVIDGCPSGIELSEKDIQKELDRRAPGRFPFTSKRKESDTCEILSGIWEGKTTGAPISIIIHNQDRTNTDWKHYQRVFRPSHASWTYWKKYRVFDPRGGGRASGRETANLVAAGAVAKKVLETLCPVKIVAYLSQVEKISLEEEPAIDEIVTMKSTIFCPVVSTEQAMIQKIQAVVKEGDSIGGAVSFVITDVPAGIGNPVYEKLSANIAKVLMSIPGAKAIEIGSGMTAACMRGSQHNDGFYLQENQIKTKTNHAGGVLGGVSSGMPIKGKVFFKPPSSIQKEQQTLSIDGEKMRITIAESNYYDPCIAIRACPVVTASLFLVLIDAILMNPSTT